MSRDLKASIVAAVAFTLLFGLAYPLLTTGVSQVLFPNSADGSRVERDGETVGSKLIAQSFTVRREIPEDERGKFGKKQIKTPDERYFQPRPSVTRLLGQRHLLQQPGTEQQGAVPTVCGVSGRLPLP